jgi:hypothetical protein
MTIYILDKDGNLKSRYKINDLKEVILVRQNPLFFALSFKSGIPLIMQSFRRPELVPFLLSQMTVKKAQIRQGDDLFVKMKSGKEHIVKFDQYVEKDKANFSNSKYLGDMHLQNFVNALACGYLEVM